MCGIAGIISPDPSRIQEDKLAKMARCLAHRGPDDQSTWINPTNNAGFAHRRLCVIDTSKLASQPMHCLSRYSIVHNGEIYNYTEVREILEKKGYLFASHSDTEVILAAYAEYGRSCVDYFDGMFAFAIWDDLQKELFCARDRFGEKPFYYYYDETDNTFLFGSELRALYEAGVKQTDNYSMLLRFLTLGHTSDASDLSATFDARIKKLPAAHHLHYSLDAPSPVIKRYWDLSLEVIPVPLQMAQERLSELLSVSIRRRLRSDVPLGTSLSGGLDSSAIAYHVAKSGTVLKTFTAAFPGYRKDESAEAAAVARQLGLDNFQVQVTSGDFVNDFEKLLWYQEQPFSSASVYAQFKVFELASREGVTVLLDGQGADETIAGYVKYLNWRKRTIFPEPLSNWLINRDRTAVHQNPFINKEFLAAYGTSAKVAKPVVKKLNDLLCFDTLYQGLEDLLRYADRNSMAHGREVRLPFLSHELVSFIFSLPSKLKIGKGYTKWILRQTMDGKLPDDIVWKRRKTGFEPPQQVWMRHPRALDYFREARRTLVDNGILNEKALAKKIEFHEAYARDTTEWRWMVAGALMQVNKKGV